MTHSTKHWTVSPQPQTEKRRQRRARLLWFSDVSIWDKRKFAILRVRTFPRDCPSLLLQVTVSQASWLNSKYILLCCYVNMYVWIHVYVFTCICILYSNRRSGIGAKANGHRNGPMALACVLHSCGCHYYCRAGYMYVQCVFSVRDVAIIIIIIAVQVMC